MLRANFLCFFLFSFGSNFFFTSFLTLTLSLTPSVSLSSQGGLQGCVGLLSVWDHGQLLLAAGGGFVPLCTIGCFLLLGEEVLLVLHPDWLG